jgi:hypothetical protein
MRQYIYAADTYCEGCGELLRRRLNRRAALARRRGLPSDVPDDPEDESSYDSDVFPKGPYDPCESDTPDHCASQEKCVNALTLPDGTKAGCWLENDLTDAGARYVREYLIDDPHSPVVRFWAEKYREEIIG